MTIEEFRQLDLKMRAELHSFIFSSTQDASASDEQIQTVENLLRTRLPASYRDFLREFGGGRFGRATIFSADPNGDWYLPNKVLEASHWLPKDLLPFSDDFCGGNYLLSVSDGVAYEPVLYWHPDGGTIPTEFETVLDFIADDAYEAA